MSPDCFIAWPVEFAAGAYAGLQASVPTGLRWNEPEDLHISLAHLGVYRTEMEKPLLEMIGTANLPARALTLAAPVLLPAPRRFAVLAYAIKEGHLALNAEIIGWRDKLCRRAGSKIESLSAPPRLDVARPERGISAGSREEIEAWAESAGPVAVPVNVLPPGLYRCTAPGSERRYERIG